MSAVRKQRDDTVTTQQRIDNATYDHVFVCGTCVQSSGHFVVNSALKWDNHMAGISLKAAKRLWVLNKHARVFICNTPNQTYRLLESNKRLRYVIFESNQNYFFC